MSKSKAPPCGPGLRVLGVLFCTIISNAGFNYAQSVDFMGREFNYQIGVPGRLDSEVYVLERRPDGGGQVVVVKLEKEVRRYPDAKGGLNTDPVDFGFILLEGDDGIRYSPKASRVLWAKDKYAGKSETPTGREELIELEYEGPLAGDCRLVLDFNPHCEAIAAFGEAERRCYRTGVVSTDEPVPVKTAPYPTAEVVATWQPGERFYFTGESFLYSPSPGAGFQKESVRFFEVFAGDVTGWALRGPDWDYGKTPPFEFAGFNSP